MVGSGRPLYFFSKNEEYALIYLDCVLVRSIVIGESATGTLPGISIEYVERGTGRFPRGPMSVRDVTAPDLVAVSNFTINRHIYIKYLLQERQNLNESTLELRYLASLISRNYDHTFYLKAFKFIYVPQWSFQTSFKKVEVIILFFCYIYPL